jgi:four helix bundle protein
VSDFKKLKVWRKAHALALNVHRVAIRIRGADHASLRNQLIRAGGSIPANLVEGSAQETGKQFARFITISINSTSELEYHLIVGRDYGAIPARDFNSLTEQTIEVRKMLYGLRNSVLVLPRKPPK